MTYSEMEQYWIWLSSVEGVGVKRFYQLLSLFEDARSVQAKLALIPEYGLQGVGYWNLMRPFPQNWQVLNALYDIRRA